MNLKEHIQEIRKTKFKTEAEARGVVDELNKLSLSASFCPMIKATCRTDCECFIPAYVDLPIGSSPYKVGGFYCDNAMFSGYCENYN